MSDEFSEWQKDATQHSVPVDVCFDRDLVAQLENLEMQLSESKGMLEPPDGLAERVEELAAQVKAKTRRLVFRSIGRREWKKLLAKHPPTDAQREEFGRDLDHNPETFIPAALAETCEAPGLTLEQATWITAELPEFVFDRIWGACLAANVLGGDEKKAVSTAAALRSENK